MGCCRGLNMCQDYGPIFHIKLQYHGPHMNLENDSYLGLNSWTEACRQSCFCPAPDRCNNDCQHAACPWCRWSGNPSSRQRGPKVVAEREREGEILWSYIYIDIYPSIYTYIHVYIYIFTYIYIYRKRELYGIIRFKAPPST